MRFEFEVITEVRVIEHQLLKLLACHGGESAEATIDRYIIGGQNFVVRLFVRWIIEFGLGHSRTGG